MKASVYLLGLHGRKSTFSSNVPGHMGKDGMGKVHWELDPGTQPAARQTHLSSVDPRLSISLATSAISSFSLCKQESPG